MRRSIVPLGVMGAALVVALALAGGSFTAPGESAPANRGASLATEAAAANVVYSAGVSVSASGKVVPAATGAYIGVFRPDGPFQQGPMDSYRSVSNKPPAVIKWFQAWDPSNNYTFNAAACEDVLARGAVPLITWEPWNPGVDANYVVNPANQPKYSLARINAGDFDAYIRQWARGVKSVNGPVMIRPMHEMNGSWYPWCGPVNGNTPAQFRSAWRRIHRLFEEEGAENVTWVWSINRTNSPTRRFTNTYSVYYPGRDYVDWTSVSGFNFGDTRPKSEWSSFERLYATPLSYLRSLGKPVILSEFGSVTGGGDKSAWIRDSYRRIKARPEIKAVVYYDKREVGLKGEQDWQITSSWQSWYAYRTAVGDPYFVPGVPPAATGAAP